MKLLIDDEYIKRHNLSQLYACVFVQILDSSIAEDFMLRHVFEDFFKLVDHRTGIVDMTRQTIARRLNIPIEALNIEIEKLESADPNSRDAEFEGRRIERLDEHRDGGWKILNWEKYEAVRRKADVYLRVSKHREKEAEKSVKFQKPSLEDIKLHFSKVGESMVEAEKFFYYYESNGWKVGRNPMKCWKATTVNWRKRIEQNGIRVVSADVSAIQNQSALKRLEERQKTIRGMFPLTDAKLKTEWNDLKTERARLLAALNFKA